VNVLVIDIGGSHVKILATGQRVPRRFPSGPTLTPARMVTGVKALARGWAYDAVAMGYPGVVRHGRPAADPNNLGAGWTRFDYRAAFGKPVRILNDAAMQAMGSYRAGTMLFLGLGTGLGTAVVLEGRVLPMELGQLPYRKGTFEDYVGQRGLDRRGKKRWRHHVEVAVTHLIAAIEPDDVVLGGGNVKKLKRLPPGCRQGDNANAFAGGFRLWADGSALSGPRPAPPRPSPPAAGR
jgi:predicted NBD/HSP70 family sugar kinase